MPVGPASIVNITAWFPSATQSKIGFVPLVSLLITCLNVVPSGVLPLRVSAASKMMTPFSLLCCLTFSTRMAMDCWHIFCIVGGGKWIYAPAGGTVMTAATVTATKQASRRAGIKQALHKEVVRPLKAGSGHL